jgi:hypothetical protein
MHIKVLWTQKTVTKFDPIVQAKLNANASDFQIKEAQINASRRQIAEYQRELDLLERAQAQFSYYLEKNSITVFNDVTIEYLKYLIKHEEVKPRKPNDPWPSDLCNALYRSKTQHLEFVEVMRKGKQAQMGSQYQSLDEGGVLRLVDSLCAMKNYGEQLKDAVAAVQGAYDAEFRERPIRVRTHESYMPRASELRKSNTYGNSKNPPGPSRRSRNSRPKTMPFNDEHNAISSVPHGNSLAEPSKKVLEPGHTDDLDNTSQLAPPPYEHPISAASTSAQITPNRHQQQSSSKSRGLRHFLRVKVLRRSP